MAVQNVNEMIILPRLKELLKDYDCCKCDKCVNDMFAIALNSIKPQYVNSNEGELYTRINSTRVQITADIDIAIIKAIEMVKDRPHH